MTYDKLLDLNKNAREDKQLSEKAEIDKPY